MDIPQIGAETTLQRTERAVRGELSEGAEPRDADSGTALRLNATGAWLWAQLEQPRQVGDLAAGLAERFEIDGKRALGDVIAFAREMMRRELLVSS